MIKRVDTSLKWNGKDVEIKGRAVVATSVFEAGKIVEAQAAALCPIDFGRLRGSIAVFTRDKEYKNSESEKSLQSDFIERPNEDGVALVGTACEYAQYVEYGTVRSQAQPYMRPAFDLYSGKALHIFEINGKKEFREYFEEKKQ